MTQKKSKGMLMGIVAGGLIGSLAALLIPKEKNQQSMRKRAQDILEKARHMGEDVVSDIKGWQQPKREETLGTFVSGALLGALIGAGSAALVTPKTGKQLRKELVDGYQGVSDKTHDVIDFIQENITQNAQGPKKKKSKLNLKKTGVNLKSKAKKALSGQSDHSHETKS